MNWTTLATFDGYSEGWVKDVIFIPELANAGAYTYLRFVVDADDSVDDPGWWIDDIQITASVGASAGNPLPPAKTELYHNFPNPFNPSTCIKYDLANAGKVNLEIYNVKGQKVRSLIDNMQDAGSKEIIWDGKDDEGRNVTSGVYFYQLISGNFSKSRKMILIK